MKTAKWVCVVLFLALMCFPGCTGTLCADSLRAFSLRETNRLLQEGKDGDRELQTFGGITRFAGMVFDRDSGDVILIGKVRGDMPPAGLDDLAVALRARLLKAQYPAVSIDMVEDTAETGLQDVRFEGGIERTRFGRDFLASDVVLKRYSLDLLRAVDGLTPYLRLYEADLAKELAAKGGTVEKANWLSEEDSQEAVNRHLGKSASEAETVQSRFWFHAMDDESFIVQRDDVYVIEELRLGVKAETLLSRTLGSEDDGPDEPRDEVGEEFARQFTERFWAVSDEHAAVKRLKVLFDLVCIAEGIAHLGDDLPNIDYLLEKYRVPAVDTPEQYALVQRVGEFRGKDNVSTLVQLSGGIEMEAILLALEDGDVSALKLAVLLSRPEERSLCWELPLDEWKMPNDQPPQNEPATASTGTVTRIQPQELGFALTVQRFLFDPARPGGPTLRFRGFSPPPAVRPFVVPGSVFNRLRRLPSRQPLQIGLPNSFGPSVLQGGTSIPWNLRLAGRPGHSGNLFLSPAGQLHEGPGATGAAGAAYHWHPLDRRTGNFAAATIPLTRALQAIDPLPDLASETSVSAPNLPGLQVAAARGDWPVIVDLLGANPDSLLRPLERILLGHALLASNRLDEAATLLAGVTQKPALVAWRQWTEQLAESHPASLAAHYLYGDALARLGRWDEAEVEFTRAPRFLLARNARGVLYAARGRHDEALIDLSDVAAAHPNFADGHATLGGLWVLQRASQGAVDAYRTALKLDDTAALPRIGLAAGLYGSGEWDKALGHLERAVKSPAPPIFSIASQNHLALLARRAEFYVTVDPLDLLPKGRPGESPPPSMSSRRTELPPPQTASVPSRGRAAASGVTPHRQPVTPAPHTWTQAHDNYVREAQRLQQEVQTRQMRWEADLRQQQMNRPIGGITMNMQKAFADRGDWPLGTFFTLGYALVEADPGDSLAPWMQTELPVASESQPPPDTAAAYQQQGDFASALAERQKTDQGLVLQVVSKSATLHAGKPVVGTVSEGESLHVTKVDGNWLWVKAVGTRKLDKPGWIHRKHVR
jgi:tetratricopeptide (TPR) repeat protein